MFARVKTHPAWLHAQIQRQTATVYREYQVYDFNGFVGKVGGFLGLFLGFSVLDMILYLIKKAWVCDNCKPQMKGGHKQGDNSIIYGGNQRGRGLQRN